LLAECNAKNLGSNTEIETLTSKLAVLRKVLKAQETELFARQAKIDKALTDATETKGAADKELTEANEEAGTVLLAITHKKNDAEKRVKILEGQLSVLPPPEEQEELNKSAYTRDRI
jgi:hypothetical protein